MPTPASVTSEAQSTTASITESATASPGASAASRRALPLAGSPEASGPEHDSSTRDRVRELVVAYGPIEASHLAERLDLTPAGVRRHLAALESSGEIAVQTPPVAAPRGRGRPPKRYVATLSAHVGLSDASSDLATELVHYLVEVAGPEALEAFADLRVGDLERRYAARLDAAGSDVAARAQALAEALSEDGYAASSRPLPAHLALQLCQGHCPVQQVAARFPQLCEAETRAFARLLGVHVQRLATIASGGHACTTHVPTAAVSPERPTDPAGKESHDDPR